MGKEKWISVKKRLPEKCQDVIVCDTEGRVLIAWYFENKWKGERIYNTITHWMPLPQPPTT